MHHTDMPDWFLRLTVPSDPRFVEAVCELAGFVADETRYTHDEAVGIRQAVDWTVRRAVGASAGDGRGIEVWFQKRDQALQISVRFAAASPAAGGTADAPEDLERGWDHVSRLMNRVEISRKEDSIVCRMSCRLPSL